MFSKPLYIYNKVDSFRDEKEILKDSITQLREIFKKEKYSKEKSDIFFAVLDEANKKSEGPTSKFVQSFGRKGSKWSQDIVELGLSMMTQSISSTQAVEMIRIFVSFECPHMKEGKDYRIPDARQFRKWRKFLLPISEYIGVSVVKMSKLSHVMHDATTKLGIHFLHTYVRCGIDVDGKTVVVDVPLKMDVCKSRKAVSEAKDIEQAFSTYVKDDIGLHASLLNVVSATSDNAAVATSNEVEKLKREQLASVLNELQGLTSDEEKEARLREIIQDEVNTALQGDCKEKLKVAAEAYYKMDSSERA
jgi:hypothetical protein